MAGKEEAGAVATELEAMTNEAAALDFEIGPEPAQSAAPGVGQGAPVGPGSEVEELAAVLTLCATVLSPALPYVGAIYTPETCQRLAGAAVPVLSKYGMTVGGMFDKWGAEVGLLVVAAPVAVQTVAAHRQWKAEQAEREKLARMRREADAKAHFEITRGLGDGAAPAQAVESGAVDGD